MFLSQITLYQNKRNLYHYSLLLSHLVQVLFFLGVEGSKKGLAKPMQRQKNIPIQECVHTC